MIKKILMSCIMTMMVSGVYADDKVAGLVVTTNNGTQDIALSNIENIKFEETQMIINLKGGTQTAISFDDVMVMTFAEVAAPTSLQKIFGTKSSKLTISDLQGRTVWSGKSGEKMPKIQGIYVVSDGKKSQKVIVKE